MTCTEFRERYTEYRDGLTPPRETRRFERHMSQCAACRNHNRALGEAVLALRDMETITPSPDFRRKLEARLAREGLIAKA
jgi:hypothetical protein